MSFVTAIPMAIKVAGMLGDGIKFVADHPDEVRMVVDEAGKAVDAARQLAGKTKEVVAASETVAKAKKTAADAGAATKAGGTALVGAARRAAERVSARKDETPEEAAARKAEAEARKAIAQARQAVLHSADLRPSVAKLGSRLESSDTDVVAQTLALLDAPGCFALATYAKIDLDRDLTDYRGVYVGKTTCVGEGIAQAISRAGNPDVYADIKYGQNVLVYVFSCGAEELDGRYEALVEVLGAAASYNLQAEA